jgi:hypothetical protein
MVANPALTPPLAVLQNSKWNTMATLYREKMCESMGCLPYFFPKRTVFAYPESLNRGAVGASFQQGANFDNLFPTRA